MQITMSADATGDGAWGTVLNKLQGMTFEVTKTNQQFFVGRVVEANEVEVTFEVERLGAFGVALFQPTVRIEDIEEMEYL